MSDSLFSRAELAIRESRLLQSDRRRLVAEQLWEREHLRMTILESAMYRSEIRARREDREN
jgi:hypothetical protein